MAIDDGRAVAARRAPIPTMSISLDRTHTSLCFLDKRVRKRSVETLLKRPKGRNIGFSDFDGAALSPARRSSRSIRCAIRIGDSVISAFPRTSEDSSSRTETERGSRLSPPSFNFFVDWLEGETKPLVRPPLQLFPAPALSSPPITTHRAPHSLRKPAPP